MRPTRSGARLLVCHIYVISSESTTDPVCTLTDGKELILIIIATTLTLTTPTGILSPDACLIYLGIFRVLLGVGVGGDYPMSAAVASDRSNLRKRGTMLSYVFYSQGWESLVGSLVTFIVLLCYKNAMEGRGETSKVDGGP